MSLINRAREFLTVQPVRRDVNRDIRRLAKIVAKAAPEPDDSRVVVSFNASTRISGLSLNAAFAMLTGLTR